MMARERTAQNVERTMKPERIEPLPWREIDGRAIIIHAASGEILELNSTATLLWKEADGALTVDEIAELASETFEVDLPTARRDAIEFYRELEARGLVRPLPGTA